MRILIWADAFWPEIGGLEVFCMHLVLRLKERGHDCLIITERNTSRGWGLSYYQEIPVYGVTFHKASTNRDLRSMREQHEACKQLIAQFNPEIIHLNSVMRGALGFMLQQRDRRRPAILTLHDDTLLEYQKGLVSAVFENVDAVVAISEFIRTKTLIHQPGFTDKLHIILNALSMPEVLPLPFPAEPRLLAFGRFIKEKGFDLAIRAFAQLAHHFPKATLTLAGHGVEHAALCSLAQETGFADRIHFPGWISPEDIPALINQHSLVIMPGRWEEPFGLVALQTAQMGRPIIASRAGGIPEIVLDGVTGKLFESEDLPALTNCLQLLLENPALCEQMGRQAHVQAKKYFCFDTFVAAYENLYRRVQAQREMNGDPGPITHRSVC